MSSSFVDSSTKPHSVKFRKPLVLNKCITLSKVGVIPSGFPKQKLVWCVISAFHCAVLKILHAFLTHHIHATCQTRLLDLIILIAHGEEYKLWIFSLCSIPQVLSLPLCMHKIFPISIQLLINLPNPHIYPLWLLLHSVFNIKSSWSATF